MGEKSFLEQLKKEKYIFFGYSGYSLRAKNNSTKQVVKEEFKIHSSWLKTTDDSCHHKNYAFKSMWYVRD